MKTAAQHVKKARSDAQFVANAASAMTPRSNAHGKQPNRRNSAARTRKFPSFRAQGLLHSTSATGPRQSANLSSKAALGFDWTRNALKRKYARVGMSRLFLATTILAMLSIGALVGNRRNRNRSGATGLPPSKATTLQSIDPSTQTTSIHIAVIGDLNSPSPYGNANTGKIPWRDVLTHTADRMQWTEPGIELHMIDANDDIDTKIKSIAIDIAVIIDSGEAAPPVALTATALDHIPTVVSLGEAYAFPTKIAGRVLNSIPDLSKAPVKNFATSFLSILSPAYKQRQADLLLLHTVHTLYHRHTSDDFLFTFLVLVNAAVKPLAIIQNSTKRSDAGLPALSCMISKCGSEIVNCVTDSTCRTALDCLNGCEFNDQVCSYRCIASYESPQLAEFSLCILQKHGCLDLDAPIPQYPNPPPMKTFRGQQMTWELAESLFIGHLKDQNAMATSSPKEQFSWRVFSGKNPAYDYFPCQYQLFYPGKGKGTLWYQPVFKVETLDNKSVWRDRLYRVRRDLRKQEPGRFFLSVLDNGVTSNEEWTILDCDQGESLEWCAFYYRGAASAAGLSYTGAVLASTTGKWPQSEESVYRIEEALERAGMKMWELSSVRWDGGCEDAPLDLMSVAKSQTAPAV